MISLLSLLQANLKTQTVIELNITNGRKILIQIFIFIIRESSFNLSHVEIPYLSMQKKLYWGKTPTSVPVVKGRKDRALELYQLILL